MSTHIQLGQAREVPLARGERTKFVNPCSMCFSSLLSLFAEGAGFADAARGPELAPDCCLAPSAAVTLADVPRSDAVAIPNALVNRWFT